MRNFLKGSLDLVAFVVILITSVIMNMLLLDYVAVMLVTGTVIGGGTLMIVSWLLSLLVTLGLVILLDEILFLIEHNFRK